MKKYISVFMLIARNSLYKILTIFTANAVVQCILYRVLVSSKIEALSLEFERLGLEASFIVGKIPLICAVSFLLVCVFLAKTGCEFSAKTGYSINRLSVSERKFFFIQSLYNFMVLCVFCALNLALSFVLIKFYTAMAPIPALTNQSIFIAFYRSEYLHALLPLSDNLRIGANLMNIIALSLLLSVFSFKQRRGKISIAAIVYAVFTVSMFLREMGSVTEDWIVISWGFWFIAKTLTDVLHKEVADETEA